MTLLEVKKQVVILNAKQLLQLKGGNDSSDSSDFIIIEDVDEL